jgi:NAD(P)-dependent dehydrogenase (short-subunit alcohol dehydrogenase family)
LHKCKELLAEKGARIVIFPSKKDMRLDGQNILITGGSRGIGRACAELMAVEGGRIGIHFNENKAAAVKTLAALSGDGHAIFSANLRDAKAVSDMMADAISTLGHIDVVINSAGVYTEHPIETTSEEEWMEQWRNILDINVLGMAQVCYLTGRHMMERKKGRIINIGSRGAFRGEAESPAYGASKAAVHALSQSLAKKLGNYGVSVVAVAPGFVQTDMTEAILETERGAALRAESPFGRVAQPEEVAHAVAFLADPQSEFLSGGVIDINGASYLRM